MHLPESSAVFRTLQASARFGHAVLSQELIRRVSRWSILNEKHFAQAIRRLGVERVHQRLARESMSHFLTREYLFPGVKFEPAIP